MRSLRMQSRIAQAIRALVGTASLERQINELRVLAERPFDPALAWRIEALQAAAADEYPLTARGTTQTVQNLMRLHYRGLIEAGKPLPSFDEVEARFHCQNGEDGIIQMLIEAVGADTKRSVEICAGDGLQCNSANLIINHGWKGLLVDGGEGLLTRGQEFYRQCADTWIDPPVLRRAWITTENVNEVVTGGRVRREHRPAQHRSRRDGLLGLERAHVRPTEDRRVEYCSLWSPEVARAIPYDPDFVWDQDSFYVGATIAAMRKLGAKKGYRLVGSERHKFNAFFVRSDLAEGLLPEVSLESCFATTTDPDKLAKSGERWRDPGSTSDADRANPGAVVPSRPSL